MITLRKLSGYLLVSIVFLLMAVAILGIWDIIDYEYIVRKTITSLFVVFIASAIILFVFTVIIRDKKDNIQHPEN